MTLAEIFSAEAREQQAAAKAAVLQWLGGYSVERFALEKHRSDADANAPKDRKGITRT
jgi:hypothetical protein